MFNRYSKKNLKNKFSCTKQRFTMVPIVIITQIYTKKRTKQEYTNKPNVSIAFSLLRGTFLHLYQF